MASPPPSTVAPPQQHLPPAPGSDEYAFGDYIFRLTNNGTIGEIYQNSQVVGAIYSVNGKTEVAPTVPEPEAGRVKKAFEDWKNSKMPGSTAPPPTPVSFESDGSAIVPLPDGTIVSFKTTYAEINKPNILATALPGQSPVTNVRFNYKEPSFAKEFVSGDSGIVINGKDAKLYAGYGAAPASPRKAYKTSCQLPDALSERADDASGRACRKRPSQTRQRSQLPRYRPQTRKACKTLSEHGRLNGAGLHVDRTFLFVESSLTAWALCWSHCEYSKEPLSSK